MYYAIRHQTKFRYQAPVSESIMELRMQPRTEYSPIASTRGIRT